MHPPLHECDWIRRHCVLLTIWASGCSSETGVDAGGAWVSNPVARHVACRVDMNEPVVCRLSGHEDTGRELQYRVITLPEVGLLYETSATFRVHGSEPWHASEPIGPHELPFVVTDPLQRIIYEPPANRWPPDGIWASFHYEVNFTAAALPGARPSDPPPTPVTSEPGFVVLLGTDGAVASSTFDAEGDVAGWSISGNLADGEGGGLRHQAHVWGGLSDYVYGVDDVQFLHFTTGQEQTKWYFEAPVQVFGIPELAVVYGGSLSFTVRSLYGNFSVLNDPLDWVTLECSGCNSGHGLRLVRYTDDILQWDGGERLVNMTLSTEGRWQKDPFNTALRFEYATECEVAAVIYGLSRIAILGDFTRAGEGVALDDVWITAAPDSMQPTFPLRCQKGCVCRHDVLLTRITCC